MEMNILIQQGVDNLLISWQSISSWRTRVCWGR